MAYGLTVFFLTYIFATLAEVVFHVDVPDGYKFAFSIFTGGLTLAICSVLHNNHSKE